MASIISSTREYRIQGPTLSLSDVLKNSPNVVAHKETESEKQEFKLIEERQRLGEEEAQKDLQQNPNKIFGQVIVNGNVFATVYDSGGAETARNISMPNDGDGIALAKARLNAIAKSVNGTIKYSDFLPTFGEGSAHINNSNSSLEAAQSSVDEILKAIQWRHEHNRL